jgi:hypothetical protein
MISTALRKSLGLTYVMNIAHKLLFTTTQLAIAYLGFYFFNKDNICR